MKQSCYSTTHESYPNYGGRGIYICAEWLDGGSSEEFVQWALTNGYQHGLDINRIDNDGPYAPWNCEFVTRQQNTWNMRTNYRVNVNGVSVSLIGELNRRLAGVTKVDVRRTEYRLRNGMLLEDAMLPRQHKPTYVPKKGFSYNGKFATLKKHAADAGLSTSNHALQVLRARVYAGWDLTRVFTKPLLND